MRTPTFLGAFASVCFVVSVGAQLSHPCCEQVESFPPDGEGNETPCAWFETTACDEAPVLTPTGKDIEPFKEAECKTYFLDSPFASFVQINCSEPPDPTWTRVGTLGNGVCCYIVGPHSDPISVIRGFLIRGCGGSCDETTD